MGDTGQARRELLSVLPASCQQNQTYASATDLPAGRRRDAGSTLARHPEAPLHRSAVKTIWPSASRALNKMAETAFTAETSVAWATGRNYFFAVFSAFSIFLMNFLGFLSKSFLQSLQHSLISRSW